MTALTAGGLYFAIIFAIGFALGTLRIMLIAPALGEAAAVLLELPLILAASWFTSLGLIRRLAVPRKIAARLLMGGLAFILLIAAEAVVGVFGFGRTLAEQFASYRQPAAALGLAGQMMFAAFPVLQMRSD